MVQRKYRRWTSVQKHQYNNPSLTLAELNEQYQDKEFENLCLDWASWLMNCIPRTKEGGFQHVTSANGDRQGVRLNESEMWIDTLFMTVLF